MMGRRLQPSVNAVGVARCCDCASPEEESPQSRPENHRGGVQLLQGSAWLSWCWPHVQERALGSLSCSFVVHGQLLSLQRPKTNRLPKPVDRVPLRVCQHFCLWIGYHLAPRETPRKRGSGTQSPAELLICRPWKNIYNKENKRGVEGNSNLYCFLSIIEVQRSLTSLGGYNNFSLRL